MNKTYLELLGLSEGATKDDIQAAYDTLRAKYLEERFMDGEVGNNAARMLTKIEAAYNGLMSELAEEQGGSEEGSGTAYEKVETLIKEGNIDEAQRALDAFNERPARWHFLQSLVFYRKNWVNESKKQLEIAMQLEPDNEKYKETYRKLNDKIKTDSDNQNQNPYNQNGSAYNGQTMNGGQGSDQMGGDFCAQCIQCCYCNMCLNCLCNGCCR
jgi:tetratricopeptide (TPR) repeat protein